MPTSKPTNRFDAVNRRGFLAGAAIAGAGVGTSIWSAHTFAQRAPDRPRLVVAVAGRASLCHLPLVIADQLDYFRTEGIAPQFVDFNTTDRVAEAVASGIAQVGAGTYDTMLRQTSAKGELRCFALEGRAPAVSLGVSAKGFPNYRDISELRGKRIGVSSSTNLTRALVAMSLQKAELRLSSVTLVPIETMQVAVTALRANEIDAVCHVDPVMTMLELKNDLRIVADARTLKGSQELFGGPLPSACLFTTNDFIGRNSHIVQAMTNGVVHGLKWLQTAEAGDMMTAVPESFWMGDRAMYLAAFEKVRESISPDGGFDPDGGKLALKVAGVFDASRVDPKLVIANTFTNDFVKRAKEKLKLA